MDKLGTFLSYAALSGHRCLVRFFSSFWRHLLPFPGLFGTLGGLFGAWSAQVVSGDQKEAFPGQSLLHGDPKFGAFWSKWHQKAAKVVQKEDL